ncbi:hypothetical protein O181_085691 [Austropuccinia psidii MF-1]|uniref:Uncharacterized protein n=1 Tax=Austropuccinia psidii MF-1 TaxID=1389203 RepID=A0A9Q3FYT4_9BASI|nr:hypothetical protein [Austropuccinia psidii MF-1]
MCMAGDELYASSPLVHKEKVTGRHHPYASKPRTPHASSSREKMVDDEDENMSPTQMETNDESRRDNFTAHEHGTQSNNEFTHPQMGLAQSMLEQSEVRQQRNQARKAHNVAKRASQKEQQKWLKAELPENVHGMRSAVHIFPHYQHHQAQKSVQSQGFQSYCKNELHKLGLKRFTWDWESSWQHPFNELMSMVFYRTLRLALVSTEYHHYCWKKDHNSYGVMAALMEQYFTYLKREWKSIKEDAEYLVKKKENQKLANICQRLSYCNSDDVETCEWCHEWCDTAKFPILAAQFNEPQVCSDTEEVVENRLQVYRKVGLHWCSGLFNELVLKID